MLLLRAVAAEVAPTRNTEAITAATNALVDSFGPDSAIDHTIVTEEFADARPKVGHTEEFGGGEPYPGEDLTDQTATMT